MRNVSRNNKPAPSRVDAPIRHRLNQAKHRKQRLTSPSIYYPLKGIDVKKRFLTFLTFFLFSKQFLFKKRWHSSERQAD